MPRGYYKARPKKRPTYRRKRAAYRTRTLLVKAHEPKWANLVGTVSASNVGTTTLVTPPSQGDAYNARDGDQISYSSIQGRAVFTAADTTNLVRLLIFQWHPDDNVDAPSVGKLLQNSTSPISPFVVTKSNRSKFSVLWDKVVAISTSGGEPIRSYSVHVPMRKLRKTTFNAGVTTGRNNVYYMYISDSGAASHPTVSLDLIYRWRDY